MKAKPKTKAPKAMAVGSLFRRFVTLVQPIKQVTHVVVSEGSTPAIFTYIKKRDEAVCKRIFEAEFQVADEFSQLEAEFHIIYLNGHPLQHFINPLPALVFSRS